MEYSLSSTGVYNSSLDLNYITSDSRHNLKGVDCHDQNRTQGGVLGVKAPPRYKFSSFYFRTYIKNSKHPSRKISGYAPDHDFAVFD